MDGYKAFDAVAQAECLALDQSLDLKWAAENLTNTKALQGNIDPKLLLGPQSELDAALDSARSAMKGRAHVLNLGHGVTPEVSPDTMAHLVEYWREGFAQ